MEDIFNDVHTPDQEHIQYGNCPFCGGSETYENINNSQLKDCVVQRIIVTCLDCGKEWGLER